MKKSKAFATISRVLGGQSILTTIDKDVHRSRRRLVSQGFSTESLTAFEPVMLDHVRTFCEQISTTDPRAPDGWTGIRDMRDWCGLLRYHHRLFLLTFHGRHLAGLRHQRRFRFRPQVQYPHLSRNTLRRDRRQGAECSKWNLCPIPWTSQFRSGCLMVPNGSPHS